MLILIPIGINSFGKVELLSEFLDSLFFFQRADKQLSILFGYDIAIQALNYYLAFIGCMDHAVVAIVETYFFAYLGTFTNRGFSASGTWNDLVRGAGLPFSNHSACICLSSSAGLMGSRCMLLCRPKTGLCLSSM